MPKISVSILSCDFYDLKNEITKIESSKLISSIHLDIMDGIYVPNISFGLPVTKSISEHTKLELHSHLMIQNPMNYIEKFAELGCKKISIHLNHEKEYLSSAAKKMNFLNCTPEIVINPNEEIKNIDKEIFYFFDHFLIMTVTPGFGGQKFQEQNLSKIDEIKSINPNAKISVDGGITLEILEKYEIYFQKVETAIIGSYFFKNYEKFM